MATEIKNRSNIKDNVFFNQILYEIQNPNKIVAKNSGYAAIRKDL